MLASTMQFTTRPQPPTPPTKKGGPGADTLFFENRRYDEFIDTVKVTEGITLTQLSLKYYGNKAFWVYIYEANRDILRSANHISLGAAIKIPSMPSVFIDPNDTFIMNSVKKLENRYVR